MHNRWKEIWNTRSHRRTDNVLTGLIEADGFDTGAGKITAPAWEVYVGQVGRWLKIQRGDSLFEVGCGSGAFLYPFFRAGHRVGGIDYSEPLIGTARQIMEGMDFSVCAANNLSIPDQYDLVIANSVFQYFPDLSYASSVVVKMIKKARKAVAVLEVPDLKRKAESEAARAAALPPGEYAKKYSGLGHLYYGREWFEGICREHGYVAKIFDQQIEHYGNSRFRFNGVAEKAR